MRSQQGQVSDLTVGTVKHLEEDAGEPLTTGKFSEGEEMVFSAGEDVPDDPEKFHTDEKKLFQGDCVHLLRL